jgi:transcriptional regulator with XRE-family HTH domain
MCNKHITLRDLRERTGRSQIDIAEDLCINHSTLSGYERGIRTPSPEMLAKMAEIYGVDYGTVFDAYMGTKKEAETENER